MRSVLNTILTLADEIETNRDGDSVLKAALPPKVNLTFMAQVGWIDASDTSRKEGSLTLLPGFHSFISAWNDARDIMGMHYPLLAYLPYAQFLDVLTFESSVPVRQFLNEQPTGMTTHSPYRTLALALGAAGCNPKTGALWKATWTDDDTFQSVCKDVYQRAPKTSGYANLGLLMAQVCETLQISYQFGHVLLKRMVKSPDVLLRLAPATIRRHVEERFQRITLVPRNEIVRKRTQAALLGKPPPEPVWTTRENLQDGFEIGSTLCKLIKWR